MSGSILGNIFRVTTWGESHGPALGAVIDGCPAGLSLSAADIQPYLDRRRPGQSTIATPRKESDAVEILSGVFQGQTTGTPISLLIKNNDAHSGDYDELADCYRPGHADYTYEAKYGLRDHLGGGRSSGRETVARVAAGAVAAKILGELGIRLRAYTRAIGPIEINMDNFITGDIYTTATAMPDKEANDKALAFLAACREKGDSCGGVVECVVSGAPAGLGEPVFGKLDARLAAALMSIGAVKAVEVGDGVGAAKAYGSENNDAYPKRTNHSGGILGGLSDGSDIILRAHIKPTPSIALPQQTIDRNGQEITINIKGRHDPVIVPRAVVVVEAMTALTLLDALLLNMGSRMENIKKIYTTI
ncbi:MAG: chorismate synthase [Lachnospiraceae bacterium]|nr:chorismate synthase [Lachnospiraceae bacterium]